MKMDAYTTVAIQPSDLVLGYRNGNPQETVTFTGLGGDQETDVYITTQEIDRAAVLDMAANPPVIISEVDGYGVVFTADPVIIIDPSGTPFNFASDNYVNIINPSGIEPVMARIGESFVTTSARRAFAAQNFGNYEVIQGDVRVTSTFDITGGGTGATMTFICYYRLVKLE